MKAQEGGGGARPALLFELLRPILDPPSHLPEGGYPTLRVTVLYLGGDAEQPKLAPP